MKQVELMDRYTANEPFDEDRQHDLDSPVEFVGLDETDSLSESSSSLLPQVLQGVFLILLALGAGWLGGRWANQPVRQEFRVVPPVAVAEPQSQADATQAGVVEKEGKEQAYLGIRGKGIRQADMGRFALDEPDVEAAFTGLSSRVQTPQEQMLIDHLRGLHHRSIGVRITDVLPDSPAARAGLRADDGAVPPQLRELSTTTGHIIIGANGHLVRSEEDLARQLALSTPGAPMEFLVSAADGAGYEVILVTLGAASEKPLGSEETPAVRGEEAPALPVDSFAGVSSDGVDTMKPGKPGKPDGVGLELQPFPAEQADPGRQGK